MKNDGKKQADVRPASVAGAFYPAGADQLKAMVAGYLQKVPAMEAEGEIMGAIAPHAGYEFSGQVAAYTHKLLEGAQFDTLVIIGHDAYGPAIAYVCPADYFETPLGRVPVDRGMVEKLVSHKGIKADSRSHATDHTVEVQLPFLQALGRNCRIVPVLFGTPTAENCKAFADAIISSAGERRVLVLASSDMSHYPQYEAARKVDGSTLDVLRELDAPMLLAHVGRQVENRVTPGLQTALCASGGVGTAILVSKARGANHAQVLHYANSGDVPVGGKSRVVGYSAVLLVKKSAR